MKRLEEILKDATSWPLRLKRKRIIWPIQRLVAVVRMQRHEEGTRMSTLEVENTPMVRGVKACEEVLVDV